MVAEQRKFVEGIGQIHAAWEVKSADEVSLKITKGTTPPKADIVDCQEIPFLRVNNLGFNGSIDKKSDFIFVSRSAHEGFLARSRAYPGDILMNIVGPPLGKVSLLGNEFSEYNMNQAIVIYRLLDDVIHREFFLAYLLSDAAQQWLQSRSKKTSGQQNLTIELCKGLPVPIPALDEQKKIAKILSTWDKAITTTEQLLANSQQQKKALMQQLLTGKKRLLDENGVRFSGEWKKCTLSSFGKSIRGVSYKPENISEKESKDTIRLLRSSNIQNGNLNDKDLVILPKELVKPNQTLEKGDLAICMANGSKALVGKSAPFEGSDITYTVGAFCAIFRPLSENNAKFVKFLFESSQYQSQLLMILAGSSINNLKGSDIESIKIFTPICLEEQQKIATVLSTADQEISVLQQKLEALKQEKKALMQQLLTGKRRVKIDNKEVA